VRRPVRRTVIDTIVAGAVPFIAVACLFAFYGQPHRKQSGDTYGTVMTAVALVQKHTIWLDDYLPYIQQRSGEQPYMVTRGRTGHPVNVTPFAPSLLAVPAAFLFDAAGASPSDWDTWMEAGMLTAAMTATLSVIVLFLLMTRLTTRRRAFLVASVYAWGTLTWGIAGQALWQHAPSMLGLSLGLLALKDRRFALAGASLAAMVACRPSTPIIALFLLPLVGRTLLDWGRFLLGALPVALAFLSYNAFVFGGPLRTGYTTDPGSTTGLFAGDLLEGLGGLLVSPGRGLLVYSPILAFAGIGAVKGFRTPFYRWTALAAAAYILAMGRYAFWWGGESFGPRMLTDALPLLALLLVPALEVVRERRLLRWAFAAALGWSVAVQALGAAAWPPGVWYDVHDLTDNSIWWSFTSNELVGMLQKPNLLVPAAQMGLALAVGAGLAYASAWTWLEVRSSLIALAPAAASTPTYARRTRARVVLALIVAASIVASLGAFWTALEGLRDTYGRLSPGERERAAGTHEDLGGPAWDAIKAQLGPGDRFAVIGQRKADDESRRENLVTKTYASYWLLPAVQVSDPGRADVTIYVNPSPVPEGARCFAGRWAICFRRQS
jgi:hypothetical protein